MKKFFSFFLFVVCFVFSCFAQSQRKEIFFVSRHTANILPICSQIGQCSDINQYPELMLVQNAMTSNFDLFWFENFVAEELRKTVSEAWSEELSKLLPASSFVVSVPKTNGNETVSVSVWVPENKKRISFAVSDKKIIAIGF